mgnify:FL=1|jgi:hypothetical protein
MVSLLAYSIQTLILAALLVIACQRLRALDLYLTGTILFWVVAVIGIYARYKTDQIYFYSNDQEYHLLLMNYYIPVEGLNFGFTELTNWRYPVILPSYFLSKVGFDPILANKFIHFLYLIATYKSGQRFLAQHKIRPKWWHVAIFCGPLLIFMSALALRDLAIAFFMMSFFLERNPALRVLGLVGTLLLRPHLAVAVVVGSLISFLFKNLKIRYFIPGIALFTVITYTLGSYIYFVGATVKEKIPLRAPTEIFTQFKFTRFAANFFGLQFLTLDDTVVAASIPALFLSRLVFFDTLLTPLIFLIVLFMPLAKWNQLRTSVFFTFVFFYGLVSQTDWNSSRQNMPFFVMMGLVAIVGIEGRKASREELVA